MAWYVFALTDAAPPRRLGKGLAGVLSLRRVPGAYALVERRADVPPIELGALRLHQDAVTRVAALVPAILPVRFGTLLEPHELDEALDEREDEIEDAFAAVRNRVQFTWRIAGRARQTEDGRRTTDDGGRKADGGQGADHADGARDAVQGAQASPTPMSGADYLRSAARAAHPRPPAAFRGLRSTVGPLVDNSNIRRYRASADAARQASPLLTMTGPWPPFAFAPEVLR